VRASWPAPAANPLNTSRGELEFPAKTPAETAVEWPVEMPDN